MNIVFDHLIFNMGFWLTWLLIPIVFEILPTSWHFLTLMKQGYTKKDITVPEKLPMISVILPVYNSSKTLYACIASIHNSTYPNQLIQVIVANNHSTDSSFDEYSRAQQAFSDLRIQWMNTNKGKSQALNAAIYNSTGQYIVNLDTDGVLEENALYNLVLHFENNQHDAAVTGTVLTKKEDINATKNIFLRILRNNEYYEYAQSFLAGRNIESARNELFTMSGAFSAFRREALLGTYLYNTQTVGEDADMTFQLRERLGSAVKLCYDAIFYVEPISGLDELYVQRQRWQRGEIEVTRHFMKDTLRITDFFQNFMVGRLMFDHTFIFPRTIWIAALFVLIFFGYSPLIIALSIIFMYLLYVFNSLINFISISILLRHFDQESRFFRKKWWVIFTLPTYNMLCAMIRFIGIINTIIIPAQWQSRSFADEKKSVKQVVWHDYDRFKKRNKKYDEES